MDFNSIGQQVASSTGTKMSIDSPAGLPMFAYEDPKNGWQVTDDQEAVQRELKGVQMFPCQFEMVSKDSKEFRRRAAQLYRLSKSNKNYKFSEAEIEAAKTVAAGIVGWSHMVWQDNPSDPKSKTYLIEFNEENLLTVLFGYRAALDKANEFIAERANFFTSA